MILGETFQRTKMENLLILYNSYYQKDVVERHIEILQEAADPLRARVAFGKVRSPIRNYEHPYAERLEAIYAAVSEKRPLQLFLTDYADMYVARVVEASREDRSEIAPAYYGEKGLDVEVWFVIDDIRRIVRDDFRFIRDRVLSNFTTPNFNDWHYAIYGNHYVYPLVVEMDDPVDYFDYDEAGQRYFLDIFRSERAQELQRHLVHYRFGEDLFYAMHPNAQDALVAAEMEYADHQEDPLYDFTAVVIQYAKAYERELWRFAARLFAYLGEREDLGGIGYEVQGRSYRFAEYQVHKPNVGTTLWLMGNRQIRDAVERHIPGGALKSFVKWGLRQSIGELPSVRNEAAHGTKTSLEAARAFREKVVGIGESGLLADLAKYRREIGRLA
jgi:hypothetical protein